MKACPHCNENISYKTLMSYSMGKGLTKYDNCFSCSNKYKVQMNVLFMIAIIAIVFAIVKFVLKADSRAENLIYGAGILLMLTPTFPLFMKVSKS